MRPLWLWRLRGRRPLLGRRRRRTLLLLNSEHLNLDLVRDTLNVFLKFEQDIATAAEQLPTLMDKARKNAESPHASHA